ncbi:hypothetical protein MHAS_02919 [Mycolicibacterium hassiacum DSM 44199]|nr:hypothetical protein MHAS_02919 [Mycolicibacterium hassiacum DSM 44199]
MFGVPESRYARYIGRVGTLAVALGIGAAVATGYGAGHAWADDDAGSGSDTSSAADSGASSTPGGPDTPGTPNTGSGASTPEPAADAAKNTARMRVGSSGGLIGPQNDGGSGRPTFHRKHGSRSTANFGGGVVVSATGKVRDASLGQASVAGKRDNNAAKNEAGNDSAEEKEQQTPTENAAGTPVATDAAGAEKGLEGNAEAPPPAEVQTASTPNGSAGPSDEPTTETANEAPKQQSTSEKPAQLSTTEKPIQQPAAGKSAPQSAFEKSAAVGDNHAVTEDDPAVTSPAFARPLGAPQQSTAAVSSSGSTVVVPSPIPAFQPTNPVINLVNLVADVARSVFSPLIGPGPDAPAQPPTLWALLAYVRREIGRLFFNTTPTAVADVVTTSENTPIAIDVLGNDIDDDPLRVVGVTQPTGDNPGTVTLNPDGAITYTPHPSTASLGAGEQVVETFTYTVTDADWHLHGLRALLYGNRHTDTGTVTVTVTGINDAPTANDDLAEVGEDGSVAIDVLGNDTDPDANDTLTVQSFTQPTNGGSVTLNPDGTFTYTPGANAGPLGVGESLTDTFTYTVTDSHGAAATGTVAVTVTGINDAPTANDDLAEVGEDGSVAIDVLGNDTDPDAADTLTVQSFTQPTNGGSVTLDPDGNLAYTPGPNAQALNVGETLTDTFTYTVSDGNGGTDTATVTVTVNGANDLPTIPASSVNIGSPDPATGAVAITMTIQDPDGPGPYTVPRLELFSPMQVSAPWSPSFNYDLDLGTIEQLPSPTPDVLVFRYTPSAEARQHIAQGGSYFVNFYFDVNDGVGTRSTGAAFRYP